MTYYGAKELATAFRTVRQNTIQTAQDIPEEKYSFIAAEGCMTVGTMLAHLAASTNFHHALHGVDKKTQVSMEDFGAYMGQAKQIESSLTTKTAIVEALTSRGEQFAGVARDAHRRTTRRARPLPARTDAAQQVALRDAAWRQGARDASPRAADGHPAPARHHPAPHAPASRGHGRPRGCARALATPATTFRASTSAGAEPSSPRHASNP